MEKYLVLLTFLGAVIALVFAAVTAKKVLNFSEGTEQMQKIAKSIRAGANAYLKRQYSVVAIFFGRNKQLLRRRIGTDPIPAG